MNQKATSEGTAAATPEIQINVVLKPKPDLSVIESNKQLLEVLAKLEGWDITGITIGPKRQVQQQDLPPRLSMPVAVRARP